MLRVWLAGVLVGVGAVVSLWSAQVPRTLVQTNDFILLFPLGLLLVIGGGIAGLRRLLARRQDAAGLLGVGLYLLGLAGALSTAFPVWLPEDDTILGSAVLAGLLAGVGALLSLASAETLAGALPSHRTTLAAIGGGLAWLVVTAGGLVASLFQLHLPLVLLVLLGAIAVLRSWPLRRLFGRPLLVALAGAVATVALLLLRGPDDWAAASRTLKLYSFPILLIAVGTSLAILSTTARQIRPPRAT